jgi:hypothetical protein
MDVFISWSGDRSKAMALKLRDWLSNVIQCLRPWMSEVDLEPGSRWGIELAKKLGETNYGIICITSETLNSPWVLFETGALAKAIDSSHVCPYLIDDSDVGLMELPAPIAQFNAVNCDRDGTLSLLRSINQALPPDLKLSDKRLSQAFEKWWKDLDVHRSELGDPPPRSKL